MAKEVQQLNLTTIGVVLIIILGFLAAIYYLYPQKTEDRTVSVMGNANIKVSPDRVVVYAQVLTKSKVSAEEAKNINSQLSDSILTALLKAGVSRSDIETMGFSVYPEYDWIEGQGQVLKGYAASNSFKVTIADFENVGKIIDAVVDNGGLINSINYELSTQKMNEYKAQVLAEASKDAKIKAESIAAGLGKSLGEVVSVTTHDYNYIPYPIYRSDSLGDLKQISTNLPSAKIEVSASVSVVYKIK